MEISPDREWDITIKWTVGRLIRLKSMLQPDKEYQRGLVWSKWQQQMFIDSIFRGYPIPAFYIHKTEEKVEEIKNTSFNIVDGQQRINAINLFHQNRFRLLNPKSDKSKFPNFLKKAQCPWGGYLFRDLPPPLQEKFENYRIVVYQTSTENKNSIRDLFIRLQGGTPLKQQEKRDSWPGKFTDFVLRIGGKNDEWPGNDLFKELAKSTKSRRRQLVAQIFMLYRSVNEEHRFCETKSKNIDEFYHEHVNFDEKSKEATRFEEICDKIYGLFPRQPKLPKLENHSLIHLFLLVNQLSKEYAHGWESGLVEKWAEFESRRLKAAKDDKEGIETETNPYYRNYAQHTGKQSDSPDTIARRHVFFVEEMLKMLTPRKLDTKRAFSDLERQTVFLRDKRICQWCEMRGQKHEVSWNECEIHHIDPHAKGGATELENAALMHRDCHPKGNENPAKFKAWWDETHSTKKAQDTGMIF